MAKVAVGLVGSLAVFGAYMVLMDYLLMKVQGLPLIP